MRQIKIEDLHVGGLKIYRDTQGFCFGTDAVLLSWFAGLKKARKICDLCTGTGIVAFLLSHKLPGAKICGVDILPQSVQLAQEAARLNGLSQRVTFLQADGTGCGSVRFGLCQSAVLVGGERRGGPCRRSKSGADGIFVHV